MKTFEITQANRMALLKLTSGLSSSQLQTIPSGFSNNILWNLAHMVAIQQKLMYGLSGLPYVLPEKFVKNYENGTFPKENVDDDEIKTIREYLETSIPKATEDWETGKLKTVIPFETRIKVRLAEFDEVVQFNQFHEGVHTGIILCILKFIR